ncbi:MAG: flavodoxin family protein [Candidatus Bathyarchaeota archaeon]|nr:flavodoxin family protein [Candidatus Bathyarchaeota archaeon]
MGFELKGIVVYDTTHGNTEKVAETLAETLKESGVEVDLFYLKDVKKLTTQNYSFLVLGAPTKLGTMSFTFKRFLGKVKSEWAGKPFAAFDTENPENMEKDEWSAAVKIAEKLRKTAEANAARPESRCDRAKGTAAGRRNRKDTRVREETCRQVEGRNSLSVADGAQSQTVACV